MFDELRARARDVLPKKYQVPAKYWYRWFRGTLEPEMRFLRSIVQRSDRVIDIGGNRGIYAYPLWRLGARVEVFEPNTACCTILTAWAAGKPAVNIHSVALSSRTGSANLHIPIDSAGVAHDASASIEDTGFAHARDELVPLQILDSYRFEDVSLIKIDVEGHEYDVIDGATATLASKRPALLVEIEQRHNSRPISEVFQKILGFGYRGFFMCANKLMALENFDVARHQRVDQFGAPHSVYINNFLFLHKTRLAAGEYTALLNHQFLK